MSFSSCRFTCRDCCSLAFPEYVDDLISKKRFAEAARLFLDYAKNARQAVVALSEGSLFSEARRIVSAELTPSALEMFLKGLHG